MNWTWDGEWRSQDKKVLAEIVADIDEKYGSIGILEWTSHESGKGNTTKALKELRRKGKNCKHFKIYAHGIGMDRTDPSWQYWKHMQKKGLVDTLYNDEGKLVKKTRI